VRNEARNIGALLSGILAQNYRLFEVIVVDDHSTDTTHDVISAFGGRVRYIRNHGNGKKDAIITGVSAATGSIIVTTDGDCTVPARWLAAINTFFNDSRNQMMIGAVKIHQHNFFSALQSIEFASLIGSAGAVTAFQMPVMCNGANLAYRKSAFEEVNAYEDNRHIASGDDEFLMRKMFQKYPSGIRFLADRQAVVTTHAQPTLHDFIQQRIRWASKWRANTSAGTRLLAVFIFAVQFATCFNLVTGVVKAQPLYFIFPLMKMLLEGIFLIRVCRFLDVRWHWFAFLVLQLVYPVYVIMIGLLSNVLSFRWKGRIHP
jgi:cellulose synthase/poly-beta-1,6-N-acetylglucosamine synthase-like glycosyltransferase